VEKAKGLAGHNIGKPFFYEVDRNGGDVRAESTKTEPPSTARSFHANE
jgi:hypothetical protein